MVCFQVHTVIALYRLDGNEALLEIFVYPSNSRVLIVPEFYVLRSHISRQASNSNLQFECHRLNLVSNVVFKSM